MPLRLGLMAAASLMGLLPGPLPAQESPPTRFGEVVPGYGEPAAPGPGASSYFADLFGVPSLDAEEFEPEYPRLADDPFEGSGIHPSRRDPLLFPRLSNLIPEDEWELTDDPAEARAELFRRRARADVRFPGPDTANFPNSAYTLPKGRAYLETTPVSFFGPTVQTAPQYNWEFLLRYGVTDNLELRLFSSGLTRTFGPRGVTGFSPLVFDFKVNFWDENPRYFLPAFGFEVYLQTDLGSAEFNGGTQPSLNLLFDQSLPFDIQFEYNFSVSGVQIVPGLSDYQFGFQWAFQRDLFPNFAVFTHGFYNAAALPRLPTRFDPSRVMLPEDPAALVVGGGAVWTVNDRLSVFGSYNAGLDDTSPTTIALLGFAVAF